MSTKSFRQDASAKVEIGRIMAAHEWIRLEHVPSAVIALWLGHESLETTHIYVEADLAMKEKALRKLAPVATPARRFKPDDALLTFLARL